MLINIAAEYARNASREDRTQADGMKRATAGFSVSAACGMVRTNDAHVNIDRMPQAS